MQVHPDRPDPKLHQHAGGCRKLAARVTAPTPPTGQRGNVTGRTAKGKSTSRDLCCSAHPGLRPSRPALQTHLVRAVGEVHSRHVHPGLDHLLGHVHRSGSGSCHGGIWNKTNIPTFECRTL